MREESSGTSVDAHVHCYPSFDEREFLRSAADHLLNADVSGVRADVAVLALTRTPSEGPFSTIKERLVTELPPGWTVATRRDGSVLFTVDESGGKLLILNGQQIKTGEGLEVLALGTETQRPQGANLKEIMDSIAAEQGVGVLTWAAGKWLLPSRRRAIVDVLAGERDPGWFMGDTRLRPRGTPMLGLFETARKRGWITLNGSDPLPLTGQERQVGRYGFRMAREVELDRPLDSFRVAVRALTESPPRLGQRSSVPGFIRDQIRLRVSA